jgi:serine/threonine-protein kinase RsbW
MSTRLNIQVDVGAMRQVRGFVAEFVSNHALAPEEQARILIVLEELITNVAKYGYRNRSAGTAEVALDIDATHLTIDFSDDGDPFDPLDTPPPDLDAPLEERNPGGLGIHIVKALADEVRYSRLEARNVIRFKRRVLLHNPGKA